MGPVNKLTTVVDGKTVLRHAVDAALRSRAAPVLVVTGDRAEAVRAALGDVGARFIHNPDFAEGLSSSLRVGLAAVGDDADAVLVCLGDMPRVTSAHIDALIDAFDDGQRDLVHVPTHDGRRGNPVLFPLTWRKRLQELTGDQGARRLLEPSSCRFVPMRDAGVLVDVDTPADLLDLAPDRTEAR
jgi:molybdenum cofactor cytidylyltransferase